MQESIFTSLSTSLRGSIFTSLRGSISSPNLVSGSHIGSKLVPVIYANSFINYYKLIQFINELKKINLSNIFTIDEISNMLYNYLVNLPDEFDTMTKEELIKLLGISVITDFTNIIMEITIFACSIDNINMNLFHYLKFIPNEIIKSISSKLILQIIPILNEKINQDNDDNIKFYLPLLKVLKIIFSLKSTNMDFAINADYSLIEWIFNIQLSSKRLHPKYHLEELQLFEFKMFCIEQYANKYICRTEITKENGQTVKKIIYQNDLIHEQCKKLIILSKSKLNNDFDIQLFEMINIQFYL